jgi:hypothetical protein
MSKLENERIGKLENWKMRKWGSVWGFGRYRKETEGDVEVKSKK